MGMGLNGDKKVTVTIFAPHLQKVTVTFLALTFPNFRVYLWLMGVCACR